MWKYLKISVLVSSIVFSISAIMPNLSPSESSRIAQEAYLFAFPLIENYKAMYVLSVDKKNSQYKVPFNEIANEGLATPKDTAVVTPNSDTPYSFLWADLRTEPLVLNVPVIDKDRYYSLQFIDLYTYDFAYVGSRTTGNDGGKYLLVGPEWHGEIPKGIKKIIHSDTDLVFVIYRTQLFNADDMDNVKKIQASYTVEPLSKFLGRPVPMPAPKINFPILNAEKLQSPNYFDYANFILQFAPTVRQDKVARADFAKIGIVPGKAYDFDKFSPAMQDAIKRGMKNGMRALETVENKITSAENLFGTREFMQNNYLLRAVAAKWGLYGNAKEEASYFNYGTDIDGTPLNAEHERYIIHFGKNDLPPVNAFWSITMYDQKTKLLVANPIKRYLINSPMMLNMHRDKDGGLSIHIQHNQPTKDKFSNWLPAPAGPFYMVLRLYWPKESVLDGTWSRPVVRKI